MLLFHRDFREYTGGHGKVWNYFNHAKAHPEWDASIYLTPTSSRGDNPWIGAASEIVVEWDVASADALFLAGMDWAAYPADDSRRPVINLVQHVRHADPAHPLYAYLPRHAIRICVSQAVADSILATGKVNGPVRVIPAALDLPLINRPVIGREGVFIGATKDPVLGAALRERLLAGGQKVVLVSSTRPRQEFLNQMANCRVAVLLPSPTEGFYLPALEAMALGCATVVPDCVGNLQYLRPEVNALVPEHELEPILAAVERLADRALAAKLTAAGLVDVRAFDLPGERAAFHSVLDELDQLWKC